MCWLCRELPGREKGIRWGSVVESNWIESVTLQIGLVALARSVGVGLVRWVENKGKPETVD
ncbi:MAG: hypothetical protein H0Z33_14200 [Bacillaceae bacterium]|nr:hypothetical protein [Bacillaceae bacterium]